MYINSEQAHQFSTILHDRNSKYIEISDEEGNFSEMLDKSMIASIRKLGKDEIGLKDNSARYMVCEYGGRHPHLGRNGFEKCNCKEKFNNIPPCIFQKIARSKFNINYENDITPKISEEMINICKNI